MPDLPQSRIELERLLARYRQAPASRAFAPLADAYRSAGEVESAVRLLQDGLQRHPDYVSAWVLLAQCELDQQNEPGAERILARVLELDPENLVALRFRGEQARRRGSLERAVEILRRLLEIDPFDRDVQADLGLVATALEHKARADSAAAAGAVAPPAAWPPEEIGPAPESYAPAAGFGVEAAPGDLAARTPALPEVEPQASGPEAGERPANELSAGDLELPPIDLSRVGQPPPVSGPEASPGRGGAFGTRPVAPAEAPSGSSSGPAGGDEAAPQAPAPGAAWHVSRQEDRIVLSPGEPPLRGPIRSVETRLWSERRPAPPPELPRPEHPPVAAPRLTPPPTPALPAASRSVPPPAAGDEFATLSMARIYESQGYLEKALAIYDELRRAHPADREVAERLASLQRRLAGLEEALPSAAPGAPPSPTRREPAEEETRVEWRLLEAGPTEPPAADTAEHLRRVTDEVRVQERGRRHTLIGSPPAPPAPPMPATPSAPPAPETTAAGSESSDDLMRPDFQRFLEYVRTLKH